MKLLLCIGITAWLCAQDVSTPDLHITIRTRADHADLQVSSAGGGLTLAKGRKNVFHRLVADRNGNVLFGYDIEILRAGQKFEVNLLPLDWTYEQEIRSKDWFPLTSPLTSTGRIPSFSTARKLHPVTPGDEVSVDILHHASTGARIYDVLTLIDKPPRVIYRDGRPVLADDFNFTRIRILLNGQQRELGGDVSVRAKAVIVVVRDLGAFVFTQQPVVGQDFRSIHHLDGKRLAFHWGKDSFEFLSDTDILANAGKKDVWVLWLPWNDKMPPFSISVSGSDTVERLLPRTGDEWPRLRLE